MKTIYWIIGGHFTSLNFHSFLQDTAVVKGPYDTREQAEVEWKAISAQYSHKAAYRFIITEEPLNDTTSNQAV